MSEKIRIQDDLYQSVNGEWLEKAVIPEDRPTTGGFAELDEGVEKLLMGDFAKLASGEKEIPDILGFEDAIKLYRQAKDEKRRNEEGIKPVLPLLEEIKNIKTIEELNEKSYELLLKRAELPIQCAVQPDMQDALKNSFIIVGPDIILPDTTYYAEGNPAGPALLNIYSQMVKAVLSFAPLSEEEKEQFAADTLAFDALVAKQVKSQVEWADYVATYNPMDLDEVEKYLAPFSLKNLLKQIYGDEAPKTIIVYDPKAIKNFSSYFSKETFALFIHWCYVKTLLSASGSLSVDLASLGRIYHRALTGVEKDPTIEKQAYQIASGLYSDPIGVYYGRTYFGEEAKKDVVEMVKKIIETYKTRVRKNAFLSEETKEKAILKLSTIKIKMGYPDEVKDFYKQLTLDESKSFYDSRLKVYQCTLIDNLNKLHKPVDRSEWGMPGHMVNASYNPNSNDITFPAAILQKPFYSLNQSLSENLGGIGAVIGHEISHAFDNNGAKFDENGNLANWWKESDFKAFEKLTKDMIEQFDGIEYHGGKVNGELVVSENIADNGGMAVTLEIMSTLKDPDYKAYFINWAKVWCQKAKEQIIQLLLASDVHSPAELRANIQPRNFKEWYEAFGVTKDDKMYIPEEKRIIIW